MPETPSSSFIPKRKAAGSVRQVKRRNIFIFSIISYALFIAAPLASAAVFIYQKYTDKIFNQAVVDLDAAINGFNESDLLQITEFNDRLQLGNRLMESHVSYVSLLNILEQATAQTVKFNSLKITRSDESSLLVETGIESGSFDALLFQRGLYENNKSIASSTFTALTFVPAATDTGSTPATKSSLTLDAKLVFASDSVLYKPVTPNSFSDVPEISPVMSTTTATSTVDVSANQISS